MPLSKSVLARNQDAYGHAAQTGQLEGIDDGIVRNEIGTGD